MAGEVWFVWSSASDQSVDQVAQKGCNMFCLKLPLGGDHSLRKIFSISFESSLFVAFFTLLQTVKILIFSIVHHHLIFCRTFAFNECK